jgi:hypothetical protein
MPLSEINLFKWAVGRADCRIEKIKLDRGFAEYLYFEGKLIATR